MNQTNYCKIQVCTYQNLDFLSDIHSNTLSSEYLLQNIALINCAVVLCDRNLSVDTFLTWLEGATVVELGCDLGVQHPTVPLRLPLEVDDGEAEY